MVNPQTTLDAALAAAKAGYKTFPVIENGKTPAVKGWQDKATTDEVQIRAMWTERDPVLGDRIRNYNVGISTEGLLVLDVDVRDNKKGLDTLATLDIEHGIPTAPTVTTASGGQHLYFKPARPVCNSAGKIGPGIDVRGNGGYVVGPGSVIDGKPYVGELRAAVDAPEWLEQAAGRPAERSAKGSVAIETLDTPQARQRAIDWLRSIDRDKRPGTYVAACTCKDFGLSEMGTLEVMDEHWNGPIHDPMAYELLATKVASAYKHGKLAVGVKAPEADFGPKPDADVPTVPTVLAPAAEPFAIVGYDDPIDTPEPEPLIDGILDKGAAVLLYGLPKTGKSFVLFEMGRCVAGGIKFADRYTEHGAVVIFCFEGHPGLSRRRKAMRLHHGDKNLPLFIVKARGDILSKATQAQMAATVEAVEARCGQRVVMVGVDTVTAAAPGADQYAPGPAGDIVNAAKAVSTAHGRTLVLVHHAAKGKGNSPLGSVAFQGSVDAVLKVEKDGSRGKLDGEMMREHAAGQPLGFELRTIHVGTTARGVAVSSAVALFGPAADFPTALTPKEAEVEELVLQLMDQCVPGADDEHADIRLAQKDVEDALARRSEPHKDEDVRIKAKTTARNAIGRWTEKRAQSRGVRVIKQGRANFLCIPPVAFIRTNAEKRAQ